jgi:hypothetical protein
MRKSATYTVNFFSARPGTVGHSQTLLAFDSSDALRVAFETAPPVRKGQIIEVLLHGRGAPQRVKLVTVAPTSRRKH